MIAVTCSTGDEKPLLARRLWKSRASSLPRSAVNFGGVTLNAGAKLAVRQCSGALITLPRLAARQAGPTRRSDRGRATRSAATLAALPQCGASRSPKIPTPSASSEQPTPYKKDFERLNAAMPQIQIVLIEGASHAAAPERPEYIQAVNAFLGAHLARTSN